MTKSSCWEQISQIATRATRAKERFDDPDDPPDRDRALKMLQNGVGPTVSIYIEARTGEEFTELDDIELTLLEQALNDWFELYARCYGTDIDSDFTLREVAEVLIKTENLTDTAQLLTHVPPRDNR